MNNTLWSQTIISQINNREFLDGFMQNMKIITRQTGVEFVIDTQREWIAWMQPGKTAVYFNPIYTLSHIQAVADKLRTDHGLETNFQLNQSHLSAIILHEINHQINHTQLKLSTKTMTVDGKTMNMLDYQQHIYKNYGSEFQRFENILEDIDVNNHATKLQASVFEQAKQDIYRYMTAPSGDFSQESLSEQFARSCLRESMLNEDCTIDPMVRWVIEYIDNPWWLLQIIKNPTITYDHQFIAIVKLYEDYYLPLKKQDEEENQKKQDEEKKQKKEQENNDASSWTKWNEDEGSQGKEEKDKWENLNNASSWAERSEVEGSPQSNIHPDLTPEEVEWNALWNESSWGEGTSPSNTPSDQQWGKEDWTWDSLSPKEGQGEAKNEPWQTNNKEGKKPPIKPSLFPSLFDNLDPDGKPLKNPELENSLDKTQQQLNDALKGASSWAEWNEVTKGNPLEDERSPQPIPPSSLSEAIQQAINQSIEHKIEADNKTPEDRTLEEQIQRERWLDPADDNNTKKIDKLKKKIKKRKEQIEPSLKNLTDRNGEKVYDKIVNEIFSKIVQIRKTPMIKDRSPRRFSEWWQFDAQSLVWGIIDMKAGNTDPSIMRNEYRTDKEQRKIGAFNITLIGDGSWSMEGTKNRDQKLNFLLILSALHQLNEELKSEWLEDELAIQTCAMMFLGSDSEEKVKTIKPRWSDLSIKDIIEANDALDYDDGDTNGYDGIKEYYDQISKPLPGQTTEEHIERLETIKDGKTKEILFVMSDGWFNAWDDEKAKKIITKLREIGIIVCGIGITADGSPMIDIFGKKKEDDPDANAGWFGLVCEKTADLGTTMQSLLLEHLEDPEIIGERK